jgi:hypothetical protein
MHVSKFELIMLGELKLIACCSLHETQLEVSMQVIMFKFTLNELNEARRMSFMDETKLSVGIPSND